MRETDSTGFGAEPERDESVVGEPTATSESMVPSSEGVPGALGAFHLVIAESLALLLEDASTRAALSGDVRQTERATYLLLKLNALVERIRESESG